MIKPFLLTFLIAMPGIASATTCKEFARESSPPASLAMLEKAINSMPIDSVNDAMLLELIRIAESKDEKDRVKRLLDLRELMTKLCAMSNSEDLRDVIAMGKHYDN